MTERITKTKYGDFTVRTKPKLVVNEELSWELEFQAKRAVPAGMAVKITVPAYQHQRSEEYLQNYDYWKPNYVYAIGEEDHIRVKTEVQKVPSAFSHVRAWDDSSRVVVTTLLTPMACGDRFYIRFGGIDRPYVNGECTPSRCSQFAYKKGKTKLIYKVEVDTEGNGAYLPMAVFPEIEVVPELAVKVVTTTQNAVRPGDNIRVIVLAKDRFNNPVFDFDLSSLALELRNLETGESIGVSKADDGYTVIVPDKGYYVIAGSCDGVVVEDSAILCHENVSPLYWGDTHVHSNLTANIRDNDGGATPEQCYWYAQNISKLDFVCLVEQTFRFDEDRSVNIDHKTWDAMGKHAEEHLDKGRFVTFNGFELHGPRGDTVVLFKSKLKDYAYPSQDIVSIHDVWDYYKGHEYMTIPHLHRYCNGRPNLDQQDKANVGFDLGKWAPSNDRETLCEIFSSQWGRFENQDNPMILKALANVKGNTVTEFLDTGKLWGIVANSDGHDGNPGYGGITGVYANDLSREGVFDGMHQRKTIGTTHTRVVMDFNINGHGIGEVVDEHEPSTRQMTIAVVSPTCMKKIEIIKNGKVWYKHDSKGQFAELTLEDNDHENAYYYLRVTLEDSHIAWTSPIFFK